MWRSRAVHIACNKPADDRCPLTAQAPVLANDALVARAHFSCVSDRTDVVWHIKLESYDNGTWQQEANRYEPRQQPLKGGRTYSVSADQPCANEAGGGPLRLRTWIELIRHYGGTISRASQVVTLACPGAAATLTVQNLNPGAGSVTSSPAGVDCSGPPGSAGCSHSYAIGTRVTLTAAPASGFTFAGWDGDCSGAASTCTVTMDVDRTAVAKFHQTSGPPGT